jgi:hypothetical protein
VWAGYRMRRSRDVGCRWSPRRHQPAPGRRVKLVLSLAAPHTSQAKLADPPIDHGVDVRTTTSKGKTTKEAEEKRTKGAQWYKAKRAGLEWGCR